MFPILTGSSKSRGNGRDIDRIDVIYDASHVRAVSSTNMFDQRFIPRDKTFEDQVVLRQKCINILNDLNTIALRSSKSYSVQLPNKSEIIALEEGKSDCDTQITQSDHTSSDGLVDSVQESALSLSDQSQRPLETHHSTTQESDQRQPDNYRSKYSSRAGPLYVNWPSHGNRPGGYTHASVINPQDHRHGLNDESSNDHQTNSNNLSVQSSMYHDISVIDSSHALRGVKDLYERKKLFLYSYKRVQGLNVAMQSNISKAFQHYDTDGNSLIEASASMELPGSSENGSISEISHLWNNDMVQAREIASSGSSMQSKIAGNKFENVSGISQSKISSSFEEKQSETTVHKAQVEHHVNRQINDSLQGENSMNRCPTSYRVLRISNQDMAHLFAEVKGEVYGPAERPELELWRVGLEIPRPAEYSTIDITQTHIIHDESNGQGVEILYDPSKQSFVLSKSVEDKLMLLLYNDIRGSMQLASCKTLVNIYEFENINLFRRRLWRKFLQLEIIPLLENTKRIRKLINRVLKDRITNTYPRLDGQEVSEVSDDEEWIPNIVSEVKVEVSPDKSRRQSVDSKNKHRRRSSVKPQRLQMNLSRLT